MKIFLLSDRISDGQSSLPQRKWRWVSICISQHYLKPSGCAGWHVRVFRRRKAQPAHAATASPLRPDTSAGEGSHGRLSDSMSTWLPLRLYKTPMIEKLMVFSGVSRERPRKPTGSRVRLDVKSTQQTNAEMHSGVPGLTVSKQWALLASTWEPAGNRHWTYYIFTAE